MITVATLRTPDKNTVVAKTPKTFFKATPTTSCTLFKLAWFSKPTRNSLR